MSIFYEEMNNMNKEEAIKGITLYSVECILKDNYGFKEFKPDDSFTFSEE